MVNSNDNNIYDDDDDDDDDDDNDDYDNDYFCKCCDDVCAHPLIHGPEVRRHLDISQGGLGVSLHLNTAGKRHTGDHSSFHLNTARKRH